MEEGQERTLIGPHFLRQIANHVAVIAYFELGTTKGEGKRKAQR